MKFWKKPKISEKKPGKIFSMKFFAFGIRILIPTLIIISLLLLNTKYKIQNSARAQTMSNSNYIIRMGNLNTVAGISTGSNYRLNITVGQTGANLFTGANYKVRAGFQYVLSIVTFRFSISSIFIDFGSINPGSAYFRNNTLTVTNGSSKGYQVTASENHSLMVFSTGQLIPDTSCDGGACNTTTAQVWQNATTYGFGYNCTNVSGTDCASDFTNSTYYRPFAASPSAATVMTSTNVGRNRQSKITYQLNISNTQAAGTYINQINYIATPTY